MYVSTPEVMDPQPVDSLPQLMGFLRVIEQQAVEAGEDANIAIYADESVTYGQLVEVLNAGAVNGLKMVLATKPAPTSALPKAN